MTSATSALSVTKRRRRGRSPAFTLVELLVVVGIIIVLTGLLLPAVFRAMRQGNRTRIASDLNAISTALEAYKSENNDYPRIIYSTATIYNGTGSGAAVLGEALLGLGDASTATFSATVSYNPGQIVTTGTPGAGPDYEAMQAVPAGNTPAEGSAYWAPIPLLSAGDGANGPGFRVRGTTGRIYGPYLNPDKFKTRGLAILDSFGNPILYYAANPSHPVITASTGTFGNVSSNGGVSGAYIGSPPAVTPGATPTTPTSICQSLYNYSDNDTIALNTGNSSTTDFTPAFADIAVMQCMLGDYNHDGYIDNGEVAATTASFLLYSAGPDGQYGPANPTTLTSFMALPPTAVKNLVNACDDVTNFSFAQ